MNFIEKILPPPAWRIPVIIVLGFIVGTVLYVAKISNVTSYASDDPKTCINCHVMNTEYATWSTSSHREKATCNDCHVPHDNFFSKYAFKAKDGMYHAFMFTFDLQPEAIKMHEAGQEVVMENCLRCHENLIVDHKNSGEGKVENLEVHRTDRKCWECHREVPHGKRKSQSAVDIMIKDNNPDVKTPNWMRKK